MTIRNIPQTPPEKSDGVGPDSVPPLLFPSLKDLYHRRAARLRQLAQKNPLGDYLRFAALIAQAQEIVLYDHPLRIDPRMQQIAHLPPGRPPLDIHTLPRTAHWQRLLWSLIAELKPEMTGQALAVLENLEHTAASELEALADALLRGQFSRVSSDKAPFIWAALSLWWAQMAATLPGRVPINCGAQRQFCPVCHSEPVASLIHLDAQDGGQRYLHCNLCESEWHVPLGSCTNCGQSRDVHCWSLEGARAAVKAESCGDCGTWLKMFWQETDPAVEPVADDLASLVLDARMEQEGFTRSGLNPFLFPDEQG